MENTQYIPSAGPQREALRKKGQFWTPDWITDAMVSYVTAGTADSVFDPAVGAGAFFRAAKRIERNAGKTLELLGSEIDPEALLEARNSGLSESDLSGVQLNDFVVEPPKGDFKAIVANPPYIRHHRLSGDLKEKLREMCLEITGFTIDGRAGLHVYFLIRALHLLAENGRLAFIMPADTCEGVFADKLWKWITSNDFLEAVVTFTPEASPFPKVDTNPVIFMIKNETPKQYIHWARCTKVDTNDLKGWVRSGFQEPAGNALSVFRRDVNEALATGLSRMPITKGMNGPLLSNYASVMRGIATGANEFFLLTADKAKALHIPSEFLVRVVGRTRDVSGDIITQNDLHNLDEKGRDTYLLYLDGRPTSDFPESIRDYLKTGEKMGIPERPLIKKTRRPWYKMERRTVPPILFTYLGRRNSRFVFNKARALPLTGFLCVYPHNDEASQVEQLWQVLQSPETTDNLALVGKSYGSGAIKVEPRALERLPLPSDVVSIFQLKSCAGTLF